MPAFRSSIPKRTTTLMNRFAASLVAAALLLTGCSTPVPTEKAAARKAAVQPWGYDLTAIDRSVKPGDDFFRFAGGSWMKKTQIPADRVQWGPMAVLASQAEEQVKVIATGLTSKQNPPGSNEQKIADFYSSYLDTKTIDDLGMKPFQADLDAIAALKTHEDVVTLAARPGFAGDLPVFTFPGVDDKNPDRYIINVVQAGISLPNREYYINKDPKFAALRKLYLAHIQRMLSLAKAGDAATAQSVFDVETKIAAAQWPLEKQRDKDLTYNPRTREQLLKEFPQYPWEALLKTLSLDQQQNFVVAEIGAVADLARLFRATPVATWRAYLTYHYLASLASIMPTAIDEESFAFYGKVLSGLQAQSERWKRAVGALNGPRGGATLAEAVGQIYVKAQFSPEAKAQITQLVHNLLDTYQDRIRNSEWMSPATREVAIRKAQKVRIKVGYPDKWRDYSKLEIKPRDAYGNHVRCSIDDWNRLLAKVNQKPDRDEWGMAPQTVNAYYNATFNEIVFPAAILQPPYFDPNADPAINYGGIGAVIGHEMGHGYDDQGAKSDENGILHRWWQKEDEQRFQARTKLLAAQFSSYSPIPGLHINGGFTSGENIGDLGGLTVAYAAYRKSLNGHTPPVLDGFSGDQRFFLGWAQVWRSVAREEFLRRATTSDFHSPDEFRVNGIVRNIDAWYDTFNIQPADKLYLKPNDRVHIW
jgi:putative endopeptidase